MYPCGAEKRKKKRTEEEKKDKGTLLKYFGAQPTLPGPADVSSSVSASTADDTAGSSTAELQAPESEKQLQAFTFTDTSVSTSAGMTGPSTPAPTAIDFPTAPPIDPVEWSELLSDSERTDLRPPRSRVTSASLQPRTPSTSAPAPVPPQAAPR
ncbi:hypothetical protein E1301_Tti016233 [Triplophysa tibetana]|uniref:Uncharacterized protein n=1 Tax=Triplophysa tibetana TaxID=1572043 RepID=A0A5A9N8I6_9TELE|nr:hypothetical protein E1301_Tti016233 [Triplophysa tibetana]